MTNTLLNQRQCNEIENLVSQLLNKYNNGWNQWSIVKNIAKDENIALEEGELNDISGILFKNNEEQWKIIVNKDDSATRQLFTIAHELGHYFLHKNHFNKFVDGQFVQASMERTELTKFQQDEVEANEFAGSLIMPKKIIEEELGEPTGVKVSEHQVASLASKFGVSSLAIITRLKNLGYGAESK